MPKNLTAKVGSRTSKGTLVTQDIANAFSKDQAELEVIEDNTDKVLAAMDVAIARALEKMGLVAEGYAVKLCPVDTGRLKNSITHAVMDGEEAVYIGTNVEYAPYIELGTSKHDAQPFLVPAVRDHADQYREILKSELGG